MKIKNLSIQGFRGFNDERKIDLDDRLTLIYAPNSYGKTSVSEALEWLLYGITSKVERADYKDEYKGSYRNRHLLDPLLPFVKVTFLDNGNEVEYVGVLTEDDTMLRSVDGQTHDSWPLKPELSKVPKPFVLQHALKYLLLAKPDERFQGFTHLLGLEVLDQIQKNVWSLCIKPESCLPEEANELLKKVSSIETRLAGQSKLSDIHKAYKKGAKGLDKTYEITESECKGRVPPGTAKEAILSQLLKIREDAVSKIFKGSIVLPDYSEHERNTMTAEEKTFLTFVTDEFIQKYTGLIALSAAQHVIERIQFYDLGFGFMKEEPEKCPFCDQQIDSALSQHIKEKHQGLADKIKGKKTLERQRLCNKKG